jgi:hypothetical protein
MEQHHGDFNDMERMNYFFGIMQPSSLLLYVTNLHL